ncbi:MAG: hypothetical protein AAGB97_09430 [Dehalococcoidia bacterium]
MDEEIKIKLPLEIGLKVRRDKELEWIIKKRIERDISQEVKEGMFLSMLFDSLLQESDLSREEINKIDHEVKKEVMERLGWE